MVTRALSGVVRLPNGTGVTSGKVVFTAKAPVPADAEELLIPDVPVEYTITAGEIEGNIIAGAHYHVEVYVGTKRFWQFKAWISDNEDTELTISDIWLQRGELGAVVLRRGDSVEHLLADAVEEGKALIVLEGGLIGYGNATGGTTDHAALENLTVGDPHTQYLTSGRGDIRYSALGHNHSGVYALVAHNHDGTYSPVGHNHAGVYSPVDHNHAGVYSLVAHHHDGSYALVGHNHAGIYSLEGHTHDPAYVYDLDAMPVSYTGGSGYGEKLQWIVNRLTRAEDGTTVVERNVVVLVGEQVYDVGNETTMPFQETGTLGTYGTEGNTYGTRYGAHAQILIPPTGGLTTKKCLTLEFRAKKWSSFGYSVVNGNGTNQNVLPTNAVIRSTAAGRGHQCIIGASRTLDGYAGLYLSNVIVVFNGVTFRTSSGNHITAFDASHCFSMAGRLFIADTGTQSHLIKDYSPFLRASDSAAYNPATTTETEQDYHYRSHGLKTPRLWNGSHLQLDNICVQGFRYGADFNENMKVDWAFMNYCGTAWKLRGMSHSSTMVHSKAQRCRRHFEAPEANDWFGTGTIALLNVLHHGGEAYHPGQYGNPAGNLWFNHECRIYDPNDLWKGEIVLYENEGELPPTWVTLPEGHGGNLYLRIHGQAPPDNDTIVSVLPQLEVLTQTSGTVTIPATQNQLQREDWYEAEIAANATIAVGAMVHGAKKVVYLKHSGAGHTRALSAASGYTILSTGTFATGVDDLCERVALECVWTTDPQRKIVFATIHPGGVVTGVTNEGAGGGVIWHDTFVGTENAAFTIARVPDTAGTGYHAIVNSVVTDYRFASNNLKEGVGNGDVEILIDPVDDGGGATSQVEATVTLAGTETNLKACIVNHNGLEGWNVGVYWYIGINASTGYIYMFYKTADGNHTVKATYNAGGGSAITGTYTLKISASGGDIIRGYVNGTEQLTVNESNRPGKSNTYVGFGGGAATGSRWQEVKVIA